MDFKSKNPSTNTDSFMRYNTPEGSHSMTIQGAVNKTIILLILLIITSAYSWQVFTQSPEVGMTLLLVGAIGGFVVAFVTIFFPKISPYTAPLYALLEGLFVGAVSGHYEAQFDGIVFQAVLLTFGTLFAMLIAFKTGLIKVTQKLRLGIVAATGAIFIVYLVSFVGSFFGFQMPYLHDATPIGIAISVVIIIVAALNLVLDFDYIHQAVEHKMPKFYEWYSGFTLLVTLIWLYIEFLRLLAKFRSK